MYFPFNDHDGVTVSLKTNEAERGPGVWKMNNNVIKSKLFKETFETFWEYWKEKINQFKDKREFWDMTKTKIKDITIEVSKKLAISESDLKNGK